MILYDLIQRFEVSNNGVPCLISTHIRMIQSGDDLLSSAINLLKELGFYEVFEENKTSQYIGYKLIDRAKRGKRQNLVLVQRRYGLIVSIPRMYFNSGLQLNGEFSVDTQFPYCHQILLTEKDAMIELLTKVANYILNTQKGKTNAD